MSILLSVLAPVFLVIGFGYITAWRGWISEGAVDDLMHFAQTYAIPCLLFLSIASLDLAANFHPDILISYYSGAILGFCLGFFGARFIFGRNWEDAVAVGFIGLFSNTVLTGLPVTERAFGVEALAGNFAIIAVHSPICYFIGITLMELIRAKTAHPQVLIPKVARAMFRHPLVMGLLSGMAVNLSGLPLPVFFADALAMLSRAGLPVALFGLGAIMVRYRPEGDMRLILYMCAVSLVVHPGVVWIVGQSINLSDAAFRSALITAAMAPGINVYIFANMYGAAKRVAASAVLIGTAASLVTVWVWLLLLQAV